MPKPHTDADSDLLSESELRSLRQRMRETDAYLSVAARKYGEERRRREAQSQQSSSKPSPKPNDKDTA